MVEDGAVQVRVVGGGHNQANRWGDPQKIRNCESIYLFQTSTKTCLRGSVDDDDEHLRLAGPKGQQQKDGGPRVHLVCSAQLLGLHSLVWEGALQKELR